MVFCWLHLIGCENTFYHQQQQKNLFLLVALHNRNFHIFCLAHFHLLKQFIIAYIFCMLCSQRLFVLLFSQSFAIPCFTVTVYILIFILAFLSAIYFRMLNKQTRVRARDRKRKRRGRQREREKSVYTFIIHELIHAHRTLIFGCVAGLCVYFRVGFSACMLGAIEMRNAVTFILGWCLAERISVSDSIYIKYQTKIKTSVLCGTIACLSSFAWKTTHFSFIRSFFHAFVRSFIHSPIHCGYSILNNLMFLFIFSWGIFTICSYRTHFIAHFTILLPR